MSYQVKIESDDFELKKEAVTHLDLIPNGSNEYHLLVDGQAYQVAVIATDFANKELTLSLNGNPYHVHIKDQYDQLVEKMGLNLGNAQKLSNIKAPMPGLVLDVLVKPGDQIQKGDQLLILEAMKMENVLKAEGDGLVKSIEVAQGAAVDKGQILIEME